MLHSVEVDLGSGRVLTIESGKMAKQANDRELSVPESQVAW